MDNITSQVERIADLSDDELSALKAEVISSFKEAEKGETTAETVEMLNALADAADAVKGELAARKTAAAELSAARDAATARINEASADEEPEVDEEVDEAVEAVEDEDEKEEVFADKEPEQSGDEPTETAELAVEETEPAALAVEETAAETAPEAELSAETETASAAESAPETELAVEDTAAVETEAVTAAAEDESREDSEDTVTAAANAQELEVPADRRPDLESQAVSVPVTITAASGVQNVAPGTVLKDLNEVAAAMVSRLRNMGTNSPGVDGEKLPVATFSASYPEDRFLGDDKIVNSERVQSVVSPSAITAAGGVCAPVEVRYDVFSFNEETGRPVRDALPAFNADRGGIRFVTPPVLSDLEGAVSVWTRAMDEAAVAGTPVKPSLRVDCGQEVVVYTDAIPLILTFGNMGARAYPELVARHTELAMVWHARFSENRLLTRIGALSTSVTGTSLNTELGITRDFFVALEKAAAGYRNRYRLDANSPLRVLLPEWLRNAMRADLVKQLPGDGMDLTFNLSDATINSFFAARNINVSWFIDGEEGQIMGAQAAGDLVSFPDELVWYLFSEGTFLFLDGGTLDLGLVRDSQLNGVNDYQIFLETFEGVAKIGIESLRIVSDVAIAGASAATVPTTV